MWRDNTISFILPADAELLTEKYNSSTRVADDYKSERWEASMGTHWTSLYRVIGRDGWYGRYPSEIFGWQFKGPVLVQSDADCAVLFSKLPNRDDIWEEMMEKSNRNSFTEGANDLRAQFRTLMQLERR